MTTFTVVMLTVLGLCGGQKNKFYNLYDMPETNFDCRDKILGGYYADPEVNCQMFHVCVKIPGQGVQDFRFLCPNETVFDQEQQICADSGDIDCAGSGLYYENFDLYRIGHVPSKTFAASSKGTPIPLGPSTKSPILTNNINEDDEFYLQRSATGDRRSHGKDILRGSSSSNFFNNRNNGKDLEDDDDVTPPRTSNEQQRTYKTKSSVPVRGKSQYQSQQKKAPSTQPPQQQSTNYPSNTPPQATVSSPAPFRSQNYNRQSTQPPFNRQQSQPTTPAVNYNRPQNQPQQNSNRQQNQQQQNVNKVQNQPQPNYNRPQNQPQPNYNRPQNQPQPPQQNTNLNRSPAPNQQSNFNRQTQNYPSSTLAPFNRQTPFAPVVVPNQPETQAPALNQQVPQSFDDRKRKVAVRKLARKRPSTEFYEDKNLSTTNLPQSTSAPNSFTTKVSNKFNFGTNEPKYNTIQRQQPTTSFPTTQRQYQQPNGFSATARTYNPSTNSPTVTQRNFPSSTGFSAAPRFRNQQSTAAFFEPNPTRNSASQTTSDDFDDFDNQEFLKTAQSNNYRPSNLNSFQNNYSKNQYFEKNFNNSESTTVKQNYYTPTVFTTTVRSPYSEQTTQNLYYSPTVSTTKKSTFGSIISSTLLPPLNNYKTTASQPLNNYKTTASQPLNNNNFRTTPSQSLNNNNNFKTTVSQPRPFSNSPAAVTNSAPQLSTSVKPEQKDTNYDYAYYDDAGAFSEYDALDALGETDFTRTSKRTKSRLI